MRSAIRDTYTYSDRIIRCRIRVGIVYYNYTEDAHYTPYYTVYRTLECLRRAPLRRRPSEAARHHAAGGDSPTPVKGALREALEVVRASHVET